MTYPNSFKDGEFGHVPGAFFGGPFDGDRYRMPLLPEGEIPTSASMPVNDPDHAGAFAVYARHDDEPIGGNYFYLFEGYKDADGHLTTERPQHATH